jgi:hypothetical protein
MTALLEQAFNKASHLPRAVQEQLARQMLEDIEAELKWDQTLATSQHFLEREADKARNARRRGKVVRKGFDEL